MSSKAGLATLLKIMLAKLILLVLSPEIRPSEPFKQRIELSFGHIDYIGRSHPFNDTDYYAAEFGEPLWRYFVSFYTLVKAEDLADLKLCTCSIEKEMGMNPGKRRYNLDIGYLDPDKLVLASVKRGPFKLEIGSGIFADMLLSYATGHFNPLPWAFADFKDGRYEHDLIAIREKYKAQMRSNSLQNNQVQSSVIQKSPDSGKPSELTDRITT